MKIDEVKGVKMAEVESYWFVFYLVGEKGEHFVNRIYEAKNLIIKANCDFFPLKSVTRYIQKQLRTDEKTVIINKFEQVPKETFLEFHELFSNQIINGK